jgi:hypothetical protein
MLKVGNETHGFHHFPAQIDDESVKKTFVTLYQTYEGRLRRDAGEKAARELPATLTFQGNEDEVREQLQSAIEKFDYKNESQVEGYRDLLLKHDKEMKALLEKITSQCSARVSISEAEAVLNMPKEQRGEALRDKIQEIFDMKKRSLESQLAKLQDW